MADDRATADKDDELPKDDVDENELDAFESELEETVGAALEDDDDDEDDEDEDDDLDDDDDDDDDEESGPARDAATGQFTKKEGEAAAATTPAADAAAPAAGDAKAADAKPDAAAPAAPADAKSADAKPADPVWEPFTVNADKEKVTIPDAHIRRENGFVYVAVPDAQYSRFQQRISSGIAGERMWRQMQQGLRELDAQKKAPPRQSDAEIESALTLELLKPHLAEILDDKDVELLEARIEAAKLKRTHDYDAAESKRLGEASQPAWEETQASGIVASIADVIAHYPELQALTPDQIEEVYAREFLPVRNSVFFREGEDSFANTQYIYDRLKAKADYLKATAKTTTAAPASTEPAKAEAPTNANKPAPDAADRFNRGVDAGTKPRTTSVKANREERPSKEPNRPARGKRRRSPAAQRARAEVDWRKTSAAYLNSDSLDFEEPDLNDGEDE